MELDSYWRTRTIAEAQSQGYTDLRVTCAGCERITDIPLRMVLNSPRVTPEMFIGNLPLRCQKCGSATPTIGVRGGATLALSVEARAGNPARS